MALELNGTTGVSLVQDGVITDANLPTGSVLQVVMGTPITSEVSSSSSTFSDTGLSATITPTSATSKILAMVTHGGCGKGSNNTSLRLRLLRNATTISDFERAAGLNDVSSNNFIGTCAINFLDTPATTSAITYKTQMQSSANVLAAYVSVGSGGTSAMSTIVLMEIAG